MDKLHNEHMQKLSTNMEKMTSSITAGFSLIQGLLYPGPPVQSMYLQTGYSFNSAQQGGILFRSGHSSEYPDLLSQSALIRGSFFDPTDRPEQYHRFDQ